MLRKIGPTEPSGPLVMKNVAMQHGPVVDLP